MGCSTPHKISENLFMLGTHHSAELSFYKNSKKANRL